MLECIIDSREQGLYEDLQQKRLPIPVKTMMLTLGDVLIQKEDGEILLMIERKTVRDLVHSLKDGRYHDQRRRWMEFVNDSPNSFVSLWIEGDLLSADVEDTMKSSLLNSLFRLQTKHHIIVHQVRSRDGFIKSLQMVSQKFEKDPYHLVKKPEDEIIPPSITHYKKSAHGEQTYWQNCLAIISGVSFQTAGKIINIFPSMVSLIQELQEDQARVVHTLATLKINEKRKLGEKQALNIVRHLFPSSLDQKEMNKE